MASPLELYCDGFVFPESPRWHKGAFYCSSIDQGHIYRLGNDGTKELLVDIDDGLSGWSFLGKTSDEIVLTSGMFRKLLKWDGEELREFADASHMEITFINDMIRMENGVCFVGTVRLPAGATDLKQAIDAPLLRFDAEGNVSIASSETSFANGMVIPPDGKTLIAADSKQQCLLAWDLTLEGTLSNRRVFASIPDSMPDGICLDADGGIWVTSLHHVYRVIEGGEITDEIFMGDMLATACMLGGDDLKTLLITAAESHDRSVINGKLSGKIFTTRVDVPGAGLPSYY